MRCGSQAGAAARDRQYCAAGRGPGNTERGLQATICYVSELLMQSESVEFALLATRVPLQLCRSAAARWRCRWGRRRVNVPQRRASYPCIHVVYRA